MPHERVPFSEAGAAMRLAVSSACAAGLTARQYRTLLAVLSFTSSWSRTADDVSLGQVAQIVFGVEVSERWHRKKVGEDLRALAARGIITLTAPRGRPVVDTEHKYRVGLKVTPGSGSLNEESSPRIGHETDPDPGATSEESDPGIGHESDPGIGHESDPEIGPPSEKGYRGGAEEGPPPPSIAQVTHRAVALLRRPTTPEDRRDIAAWIAEHGTGPSTAALDALDGRGFEWWSKLRRALDEVVPPRRRSDGPSPSALSAARDHGRNFAHVVADGDDLEEYLDAEYYSDSAKRAEFLAGRAEVRGAHDPATVR